MSSDRYFRSVENNFQLMINLEEDREFLEDLGIHNENIKHFLRGSYQKRGILRQKTARSDAFFFLALILLLSVGIYSLTMALDDGWIFGYIIFGFGVFFPLIIIIVKIARAQARRDDPFNIKTKECINYVVLKSIDFFTEEFSLIEVDKYVVDDFIQFHSRGIELEFDDIKEMVEKYSIDEPKEEIIADYLGGILNPIEKK